MAKQWPYMDLENVGIWGHSAGGYDSVHAILSHPQFYKAAVSSAGARDVFLAPLSHVKRSVYQDRLGTNMRKG